MTKALGKEPSLNGNATVVPAGVVRIVDLVNEGYILVKP
jgi:intracellular sulfur oxidation DsrE/DsrF family protein